jgi:hypothetical protein
MLGPSVFVGALEVKPRRTQATPLRLTIPNHFFFLEIADIDKTLSSAFPFGGQVAFYEVTCDGTSRARKIPGSKEHDNEVQNHPQAGN